MWNFQPVTIMQVTTMLGEIINYAKYVDNGAH